MSKITEALEVAVAAVHANTPAEGVAATARQRAGVDRAFAEILRLIAPRIRHFIRQYGLAAHWDDAEQCCAIGVHRAIQAYDPAKAQFTTFVNWQLRGELQGLRFRLMTDQRPSAKRVEATTVSLHGLTISNEGDEASLESMLEDEEALARTEARASEHLAAKARTYLVDGYVAHLRQLGMDQLRRKARQKQAGEAIDRSLPRLRSVLYRVEPGEICDLEEQLNLHRKIAEARVFDDTSFETIETVTGLDRQKARAIATRAQRTIAELAKVDPRFSRPRSRARRETV